MAALAGSFIGLVGGGLLAEWSWRAVFFVSVPIGVVGTVWAYHSLHELGTRVAGRIDWAGNVTFAVGLILVMVGVTDRDLADAARAVKEIGGGYVAVADGKVLASVPLPIAGIMSDQPWETVRKQSIKANKAAASLGCAIHSPFMIMAFIGLAGVPDLGLTEKGLIDTASQSFTDLVLGMRAGMVCCRCPDHIHDVHRLMDPSTFRAEPV